MQLAIGIQQGCNSACRLADVNTWQWINNGVWRKKGHIIFEFKYPVISSLDYFKRKEIL